MIEFSSKIAECAGDNRALVRRPIFRTITERKTLLGRLAYARMHEVPLWFPNEATGAVRRGKEGRAG